MTHSNSLSFLLFVCALVIATIISGCNREPSSVEVVERPNVDERQEKNSLRVAFVAYGDSELAVWRAATRDLNFELRAYRREEFLDAPLEECNLVILRAIGWVPSAAERDRAARLIERTQCVGYAQSLDFAREVTNVAPDVVARLNEYLAFSCEENARFGAAYIAEKFGEREQKVVRYISGDRRGEILMSGEPVVAPNAGFFYRGAQINDTYDDFEARRISEGRNLPEDAPRIALFGDFLDPFKELDREPVDELITKLEARGFNVYPIYKVQHNRELLSACRPDLCVYFPRGRVFAEGDAFKLFNKLNSPVLSAILLSSSEEEWRAEPIGASGSYFSLATALPELDGVIEPLAIATKEPNADGAVVRRSLSERIDSLVERCASWNALRRKSNGDKRLAIFYYKSPGATALTAQSLEVVDSLYNVLTRLRSEGYNLGDSFPTSSEALRETIERRGRTIGLWELGTFSKFVEEAEPEIIPALRYRRWFEEYVPESARKQITSSWGAPPGEFMTVDRNSEYGIVLPRIEFGNVALIPQPTTDVLVDAPYSAQGNDFDAVHGTDKAPPHFYLAAYLWARYGFDADAIIHFGTHGSLEFTHGKSALMTESCFPDVLIGDLPHVYVYSINNIGEAFLAKRRARATIVSHLTPPFAASGLYGDLELLDEKTHEYKESDEPLLKNEYATSITELTIQSGLIDDLISDPVFSDYVTEDARKSALTNGACFSDEQIDVLHALLHRYENATTTDGLHVIGRPWSEDQLASTSAESRLDATEAQRRLRQSFTDELDRFVAALDGSFIPPSTGGDFLHNPDAAPTGRNLAGLDIQKLPTVEAERIATRLTDDLLATYRRSHGGAWPRRVACTLWGGESTRTQGVGIAQVLALIGARIARDSRGSALGVELIPSEELGRPRIDALVQTSGQFRDSFGAKIELIDQAVRLVVAAPESEPYENYVRENSTEIARRLVSEQGLNAETATDLSSARVFGATNALSYGTGIMRLVERGDMWTDETEVAERYIANMSGVYRNADNWGKPTPGLLEYNLDGLDLAVQTRSSNVWGPAKLDHIYEFATLAAAARAKTGRDPEIWFDDLRDPTNARVESARSAMREELQTTLWNPKYLQGLQREGASAAASVAKTTRNLFGWSVAQPGTVDAAVWEETKAVLVDDVHGIGVREWFEAKNPTALQDLTAIMLESIRKGYWRASLETQQELATLHAELTKNYGASGSYESTGNKELRRFVVNLLPDDALTNDYQAQIDVAIEAPVSLVDGLTLTEVVENASQKFDSESTTTPDLHAVVLALLVALCAFLSGIALPRPFR